MFLTATYRQPTSRLTNTDDQATGANTFTSQFYNTADNNVVNVRAVVEPSEIEKPTRSLYGPERVHHLMRKPQAVPRGAPLHTKWRLTQQRPRDGLIS